MISGRQLNWNSIRWPGFEGCNQRVAQRILRIGNVAGARGDVGDQSFIRITRNGFNRIMRRGFAHRGELHRLRRLAFNLGKTFQIQLALKIP